MDLQTPETKITRHRFHRAVRIDMTPMVDLGFLLITFFIFTTTMSQPTTMKLYMPDDRDSTPLGESKALTVILGNNNKVYAYEGAFEDALRQNRIISTNNDESEGIGNIIRQKQKRLANSNTKTGKVEMVLLIKPTKQSTYKNIIDALDETTINGVKKYMIIDASIMEDQIFRE